MAERAENVTVRDNYMLCSEFVTRAMIHYSSSNYLI